MVAEQSDLITSLEGEFQQSNGGLEEANTLIMTLQQQVVALNVSIGELKVNTDDQLALATAVRQTELTELRESMEQDKGEALERIRLEHQILVDDKLRVISEQADLITSLENDLEKSNAGIKEANTLVVTLQNDVDALNVSVDKQKTATDDHLTLAHQEGMLTFVSFVLTSVVKHSSNSQICLWLLNRFV